MTRYWLFRMSAGVLGSLLSTVAVATARLLLLLLLLELLVLVDNGRVRTGVAVFVCVVHPFDPRDRVSRQLLFSRKAWQVADHWCDNGTVPGRMVFLHCYCTFAPCQAAATGLPVTDARVHGASARTHVTCSLRVACGM